jgi:integrase/recombinase XerD
MPKKGQRIKDRKPSAIKPKGGTPRDPETDPMAGTALVRYMELHLEWLLMTGHTVEGVKSRRNPVRRFVAWCMERGIADPRDVTKPMLERYQRHLFYYRKTDGAPLTIGTQSGLLAPLKSYFQWLARENHILYNPASELQLPKQPKSLPKTILTIAEVEAILAEAVPDHPGGLRDRALLETLYSTGLRRMEIPKLMLHDVDLARGIVNVRGGKGGKDRVIPIGARAIAWLDKYLLEARPQLLAGDTQAVFVTDYGDALPAEWVATKVKRYMEFAGIHKPGSTHLLRHACATHMLEGGADIRFIQAMLGHSSLTTTEIYTHVSIDKLRQIHAASHPARLERRQDARADADGSMRRHGAENPAAALMAALAAEADEEGAA